MKCIPNYYTIDGDECVPCPKSAIGQWILAFILIFICLYTVHKLLKEEFSEEEENDNEDDEKSDEVNNNDANKKKMKRQKSIRKFQRGIQKSVNKSTRIQSAIQTTVSVLAKHSLVFSFAIPEIPLIHLPQELRRFVQSVLNMFTFDLSNFISSPQCDWNLPTEDKHVLKMLLPILPNMA